MSSLRPQMIATPLLGATCVGLLACAGGADTRAAAATTWQSRTVDVDKSHVSGSFPVGLAYAADGSAIAAYAAPSLHGSSFTTQIINLKADGDLGQQARLTTSLASPPQLASDGHGGLLAYTATRRASKLSWVPLQGGRAGEPQTLSKSATDAKLEVNERGQTLATWLDVQERPDSSATIKLRVARGTVDAGFGRAQTLTTTHPSTSYGLDAAIAADGTSAVAFADPRSRVVRAWRGSATAPLAHPVDLGRHRGVADIAIALSATGRLTTVWGSQKISNGLATPWQVRIATLDATHAKSTVTTLDSGTGSAMPVGDLDVATSRSGDSLAIWTSVGAVRGDTIEQAIKTAAVSAQGQVKTPRTLADGASAGSVVAAADGKFAVSWTTQRDSHYFAAIGPAESLTTTDLGPSREPGTPAIQFAGPMPPRLTLNAQGRPVIAYTRRSTKGNPGDQLVIAVAS